jgi:hypothetical protein
LSCEHSGEARVLKADDNLIMQKSNASLIARKFAIFSHNTSAVAAIYRTFIKRFARVALTVARNFMCRHRTATNDFAFAIPSMIAID